MKRVVFTILISLFILSSISTKAQLPTWVDSLIIEVNTNSKLTLREKMGAYTLLTAVHSASDMKNTYQYGIKGLELAQKINEKKMIAAFYRYIGSTYTYRTSYDTAYIYQHKHLDIAEELQDKELLQSSYFGIANLAARQGKFLLAVENYQKSMTYYSGDTFAPPLFNPLTNLEKVYEYLDPLRIYVLCLGNIGECYRRLNNPEKALSYLTDAKELIGKIGSRLDPGCKSQIYRELGYVYFAQGDIDKALESYQEVLSFGYLAQVQESDLKEAMIKIYILKKEYDKAFEYANDCLMLAESLGDPFIYVLAWNSFSEIYRAQGLYKECESAAMKAWEIDSTSIDTAPISARNIAYANLYLGNKEKATYFFTKNEEFSQQKSDKNFHEAMADVEVRYETEKKEMRIATLEKERQLYIWLSMAGILLAVSFGFFLWQKVKNAQKEKLLIATQSVLNGEMGERTRLARDLHDRLSGSLSAIKIGLNNDNGSMSNLHDKLDGCIEEIRRVSHNLMPVSLQHGIKVTLEDFAAQFPNVHFHFFGEEKRLEERIEFILYCCASELVNNSLRHAGAQHINLQLVQDEKYVTLTIQDDGCGFNEKTVVKGIGLKNICDRVTSCGGKIDITTSPGKGTETIIELKTANI